MTIFVTDGYPHLTHPIESYEYLLCIAGTKMQEKFNIDSKVHGDNMGPIWGRQDPGGPHVGPMNFTIWEVLPWRLHDMETLSAFVRGITGGFSA